MRVPRRLLALLLASLLALALGACDAGGDPEPAALPAPLPQVTLSGFDGGPDVDLGAARGPMVINLWASWCGPCRQEMPLLQSFHERYGDEVALLGIDFQDQQPGAAADLVAETGVTYDLASDPDGAISGQGPFPHPRGLPYLAFVNEAGEVTHVQAVRIHSVAELVAMVDEHLGVTL